jgi:sulfur-carrier protein
MPVIESWDMGKIKINLLLFGACREAAGVSEFSCEIDTPVNVTTAWSEIKQRYPNLERFDRSVLFAVNEDHARREDPLRDGDTLAIFPPVSGG